jgi:hypothetical protein
LEKLYGDFESFTESLKVRGRVREKPATGTLGCRTCDPEELLAETQVVVPQSLTPVAGGAEPGWEGKFQQPCV